MDDTIISTIRKWIHAYKLPILIVLIVLLSSIVVVSQKMIEITENPAFCGKNCHIMRPYYDSWRTSSHNDVACVECHYEPGLIGHIKGKINGLMQFYSYETTVEEYSGKLYAKVMDKNCLVCHKKRIFSSEVDYMGVNFSHLNHLLQPKRGIELTCTSCHSMLVIGMKEHRSVTDPSCTQCHPSIIKEDMGHIVVTTSTCFTCHFRDVPRNTSISGCPSCHGAPKETHRNYTNFNHSIHLEKNIKCMDCHTNISVNANDIVQKKKCYSCHNVRKRVEKYDDFEFIHRNHVTRNKIACYECHSNVKHLPGLKENLCAICHGDEHPRDWLKTHKKEVLIGKICSDCHLPKFCIECHASVVAGRKKLT
jgi:hypothetical protein